MTFYFLKESRTLVRLRMNLKLLCKDSPRQIMNGTRPQGPHQRYSLGSCPDSRTQEIILGIITT